MLARLPNARLHYAWVIFAVTGITLLAAAGIRSTPGVLIVPLEAEFGWSRATISLAVSINLVLFGLVGPFAAAAMDRFGIRVVVSAALLLIATGAGLTALMSSTWQLYLLWGVVVGLGAGTMAEVFAATVANRWFVRRRGTVIGILAAATATGQLLFLPFLGLLVQETQWRYVSLTVALCTLVVVPLVLLFLRERPEDLGLRAYGASEDALPSEPRGNPIGVAFQGLSRASRHRTFWLLAATFFVCGASTYGLIGTHLIPAGIDHGMGAVAAASMLAVIGIFDVVGTVGSGWLTDRFDPRKLLFAYYGLRGLSLLLLPLAFASPNAGLILFIVFYGLDWVATVPPTITITTESFGLRDGPIIYGWVFTAHQLGGATVATAAGVIRTATGGYELAFLASGLLCLGAAGLSLLIRRSGASPTVTPLPLDGRLVRVPGGA
jgi:predicted MFS family arabinose efflux permease